MKYLILLGAMPIAILFLCFTVSLGLWGLIFAAAPGPVGAVGLAAFFIALGATAIGINTMRLLWVAAWQ